MPVSIFLFSITAVSATSLIDSSSKFSLCFIINCSFVSALNLINNFCCPSKSIFEFLFRFENPSDFKKSIIWSRATLIFPINNNSLKNNLNILRVILLGLIGCPIILVLLTNIILCIVLILILKIYLNTTLYKLYLKIHMYH